MCSILQIKHPRSHLNRFDLVITPRHDYYALTPQGQEQVPRFLRSWITPCEPPDKNVVCIITGKVYTNFDLYVQPSILEDCSPRK